MTLLVPAESVMSHVVITLFGPQHEKTCLPGFANNTGTDQPAHPCRLISTFLFRFLKSIICQLGTGKI